MKKVRLLIAIILMTQFILFSSNSVSGPPPIAESYDGFWLDSDEGYGLNITVATTNGTVGINLDEDAWVYPGDAFLIGIQDLPANWTLNEYERLNASLQWPNGEAENGIENYAPWAYDALTIEQDFDGPPIFFPMIPIGDVAYFSSISDRITFNGFSVADDGTYLSMSYTNVNGSASVTWTKATGLIYNYTFHGKVDNGQTDIGLELEYLWALSPTHSPLSWYSEDPLIDYEILQANGTSGWSFDVNNNGENNEERSEHDPMWGQGRVYQGELLQVSLDNFRGFEIDGPAGYEMSMRTESGEIGFNISIELPEVSPENNTFFLYPLFPSTDRELVDAYFGMAPVVNSNYTTSVVGEVATLVYEETDAYLEARWDLETDSLTYWKMIMTEDGLTQTLEFAQISFEILDSLAPTWGETAGAAHSYKIQSLNTSTGHEMSIAEEGRGTGSIKEGETVYFELVNNTVFGDEGALLLDQDDNGDNDGGDGPQAWYNLVGPSGQSLIRINFQYPGMTEFDGPPMLYPHLLLGSEDYFEWADTLYTWMGATFDYTATEINFDWTVDFEDITGVVSGTWDRTTGVLQEYLVSIDQALTDEDMFEMHLVYDQAGKVTETASTSPSDTSETTTTTEDTSESDGSPGLPFSTPYVVLFALITIPILKRKFN
ncbi:MAG: hypothetical protein ACXAD7_11975 [Candidatus Kariarchaeaceae archaeon]